MQLPAITVKGKSKTVCACKDFCSGVNRLFDFCSIKNTILDSDSNGSGTELDDIMDTITRQQYVSSDVLRAHFWDVFVADALLGNFDRHNGNWGFLYDDNTGETEIAPMFDCGSGLRKIVSETEKLPGYTVAYKPEFSSTATDFRVILKNVNYNMCDASVHDAAHDTAHDAAHDTSVISKQNLLLEFCADPKSRGEMQAYIDVSSRSHFSKYYLKPLLSSGKLEMMFPDKPKSKNQKYTTVHSK